MDYFSAEHLPPFFPHELVGRLEFRARNIATVMTISPGDFVVPHPTKPDHTLHWQAGDVILGGYGLTAEGALTFYAYLDNTAVTNYQVTDYVRPEEQSATSSAHDLASAMREFWEYRGVYLRHLRQSWELYVLYAPNHHYIAMKLDRLRPYGNTGIVEVSKVAAREPVVLGMVDLHSVPPQYRYMLTSQGPIPLHHMGLIVQSRDNPGECYPLSFVEATTRYDLHQRGNERSVD